MAFNITKHNQFSRNLSIGLFIENMKNNNRTSTFFSLNDVDLYYQPVEAISVGILFFSIRLILVIIGWIINLKLYFQISKETCLVKDVTKVYTITQIAFLPIWFFFNSGTDFFHPLNEIIGQWFCTTGWFLIHFCGTLIAFYSLVVSLMRYFFIIHEKRVELYGKKKAQRHFSWLIIIIPLIMVLWESSNGSDLDVMSVVNKCYGKDHKIFLIETSTSAVFRNKFCEYDNYDKSGSHGNLFSLFRRFSCVTNKLCLVLTSLNVTEGIVYCRVLAHISR